MQPHELEWIAGHLDHDDNWHKQFNTVHESTIELCKVAKLLPAIDSWEVGSLEGMTWMRQTFQVRDFYLSFKWKGMHKYFIWDLYNPSNL